MTVGLGFGALGAAAGLQAARLLEVHLMRVRPTFVRLLDKAPPAASARSELNAGTLGGYTYSPDMIADAVRLSDEVRLRAMRASPPSTAHTPHVPWANRTARATTVPVRRSTGAAA